MSRCIVLVLSTLLFCLHATAQEAIIGSGVTGDTKAFLRAPIYVNLDTGSAPSNASGQQIPGASAGQAGQGWVTSTAVNAPFPTAGTLSNLCVMAATAITTGSYTVTINTGSAIGSATATSVSVTLNSTTQAACDTIDSATITGAGAQVSIGEVPTGTPTATKIRASFEFTSSVGQEAPICTSQVTAFASLGDSIGFENGNADVAVASESTISMLFPDNGIIDNLYFKAGSSSGSGNTWTATIYHNGSATSLVASAANTANASDTNAAHAFTVSAGDTISLNVASGGGTPAVGIFNACVRWRPTTSGEYPIGGVITAGSTAGSTKFAGIAGAASTTGISVETNEMGIVPIAHTLKNLYLKADSAQGAAKTWAMTMRSGAVPGSSQSNTALTETLSNATSGQCSCSATLTQEQLVTYSTVVTSSATVSAEKWAAIATIP